MKPLPILILALLSSPLLAHACGMEVPVRGTPAERVATAWKYLDQKLPGLAFEEAYSVVENRNVAKPLRAQAELIMGFVDWKNGQKEEAMAELAKARKLDPQALELVRSQHSVACYWTTGQKGMVALLETPTK